MNATNKGIYLQDTDQPLLDKLPIKFRDALVEADECGDYESTALKLGVPMGTLKSRLSRARVNLIKLRAKAASEATCGEAASIEPVAMS